MKLKSYHIVIIISLFFVGCHSIKTDKELNSSTKIEEGQTLDTVKIANDSLEYEIIIMELGFNAWLATQPPRGYYSQSFLENRNRFFVTEYNIRVNQPLRYDNDLYPLRIDYESRVNYGYEVNYLLFNYFLFFQQKYNQRLNAGLPFQR